MSSINWESLEQVLPSKRSCYDFEKYQGYFRKVAFDCYKANTGSEQLWELRKGDDGKMYLYALYDQPEDVVSYAAQEKTWEANADHKGENVTLAFKGSPVYTFASSNYGFSPERAAEFAEFVMMKTAQKEWIDNLLNMAMSEERRSHVEKILAAGEH